METGYLQDPSQCGNVLKGFEGFLSSSKSSTLYGHEHFLFVMNYILSFYLYSYVKLYFWWILIAWKVLFMVD